MGVYILTRKDLFMNHYLITSLSICSLKRNNAVIHPVIIKPKFLWTGKQLLKKCTPRTNQTIFSEENLRFGLKNCNNNENLILIDDGYLLTGSFSKRTISSSNTTLT